MNGLMGNKAANQMPEINLEIEVPSGGVLGPSPSDPYAQGGWQWLTPTAQSANMKEELGKQTEMREGPRNRTRQAVSEWPTATADWPVTTSKSIDRRARIHPFDSIPWQKPMTSAFGFGCSVRHIGPQHDSETDQTHFICLERTDSRIWELLRQIQQLWLKPIFDFAS